MDTEAAAGPLPPANETVITREVVAAVSAHAAAATPGVVRLETSVGGLLAGLGRSARSRIAGITPYPVHGTTATVTGDKVTVRVEVAVSGGQRAADTAAAVQRSVARAVTAGTGLTVAGVTVAILDVVLGAPAGLAAQAPWAGELPGPADGEWPGEPGWRAGSGSETGCPTADGPPGSRGAVTAAVLGAIRSVPGLRPASLVRPERTRWMPWDPAVLAVGLDDDRLEVQLAATRLPLPPLLGQAAAAVRAATAETRWAVLPQRLVVTAVDARALTGTSP
jgi:uncharacterized alkaline shock family protein YloU